nr:MAG TPA: hypothetical protein [Caudoviricetes sp.]
MAADYSLTIQYDSGVESVVFSYGSNTHTFSTSGEKYGFSMEPGNDVILNVVLKNSYNLESATLGTISNNTITIPADELQGIMTCQITSVATPTVTRKSYDLSTSAKWATLSSGNHNVQIVAKASGYRDSEKSAAAVVKKAYPSVTLKAGTYQFKENPVLPTEELNATMAFKTKLYGATDYSEFTSIKADSTGIDYINSTTGFNAPVYFENQWQTSTSQRVIVVENDAQVPSDFLTWFENATYVPLKRGTYQFIADVSLSNVPSNIYVPFTSDGVTYSQINFSSGLRYVSASTTTPVYSASSGWVDEKYRVITVTEDTFIYRAQYIWFTANSNAYTPTRTLEAGTYKFIGSPVLPSVDFEFPISGLMYTLTANNVYGSQVSFSSVGFIVGEHIGIYSSDNSFISFYNSSWEFNSSDGDVYTTTDTNKLRTITLSTAQPVSADFYKWAITDGNLVKQESHTIAVIYNRGAAGYFNLNGTDLASSEKSLSLTEDATIKLYVTSGDLSAAAFSVIVDGVSVTVPDNKTIDVYKQDVQISVSYDYEHSPAELALTINYHASEQPTSETWLLKEVPSITGSGFYNISFTSNGESFNNLSYNTNDGGLLAYGFSIPAYNANNGWTNQAYRTITFSTPPTGDLLVWLRANGLKLKKIP